MILDTIKNAELYYSVSPRLAQAFDYINSTDLESLTEGRHDIDGDNLFVNIMVRDLKEAADAKVEVHNTYVDIQVLICGEIEGFGYIPRCDLKKAVAEFDAANDIQFFEEAPQTIYYMKKGQFTILLPQDGHAPLIGSGKVKKAIFKVKL